MLPGKLVRTIDEHREAVAEAAVQHIRRDAALSSVQRLPDPQLQRWATDIVGGMSSWIGDADHEPRAKILYAFGQERFRQQVPLVELVRMLHICREHVVSHVRDVGFALTPVDIYVDEEMEHDLAGYFEFATYHIVTGYEAAREREEHVREIRRANNTLPGAVSRMGARTGHARAA